MCVSRASFCPILPAAKDDANKWQQQLSDVDTTSRFASVSVGPDKWTRRSCPALSQSGLGFSQGQFEQRRLSQATQWHMHAAWMRAEIVRIVENDLSSDRKADADTFVADNQSNYLPWSLTTELWSIRLVVWQWRSCHTPLITRQVVSAHGLESAVNTSPGPLVLLQLSLSRTSKGVYLYV